MNQQHNLPSGQTKLGNQMRRVLSGQASLRPATSPGMYTSQTVSGVIRRPKARVSEDSTSTSIVPRWG